VKKHIVKALKWALSKFEDKKPELTEWPFPVIPKDFNPRPCKTKKVTVPKATTRKPAAKKIVKNVEKIVKKKAK